MASLVTLPVAAHLSVVALLLFCFVFTHNMISQLLFVSGSYPVWPLGSPLLPFFNLSTRAHMNGFELKTFVQPALKGTLNRKQPRESMGI